MNTDRILTRPPRRGLRAVSMAAALVLGLSTTVVLAAAPAQAASPTAVNSSWLDYYFNSKGIGGVDNNAADVPNFEGGKGFHRKNLILGGMKFGVDMEHPTDPSLKYRMAGDVVGSDRDNVEAQGQVVNTAAALGSGAAAAATKIAFIWSAHNAGDISSAPVFTLNFNDNSSMTASFVAPDWCSDGNSANTPVASRQARYGDNVACTIFATQPVSLPAGKKLESIKFPTEARVHVFAIASNADTANATNSSVGTINTPASAVVGSILAAPAVTWSTAAPARVTGAWFIGDTRAGEDTTSARVVPASWAGKTLTYKVVGHQPGLRAVSYASSDVAISAATISVVEAPSLTGSARVGYELSVDTGKYSVPGEVTTSVETNVEWRVDGQAVDGASSAKFKPTVADIGKTVSAHVTVKKVGFSTLELTAGPSAAVAPAATVIDPPVIVPEVPQAAVTVTKPAAISGNLQIGQVLTATPGTFAPAATPTYQWLRGTTAIRGATSAKYQLTPADLNAVVSVRVTAKAALLQPAVQLRTGGVATAGTLKAAKPTITAKKKAVKSAKVKVGTKLATKTAKVTASGSKTKATYQWYAGSKKISGSAAKKSTFKVTKKTLGKKLRVQVTYTAKGYVKKSVTSSNTGKVVR